MEMQAIVSISRRRASVHLEEVFETNLAAHRKLHPLLVRVDLALQIWSPWARPSYAATGYPTRWVTERMREGGIIEKGSGRIPQPVWPENVAATDSAIARLPTRHIAAIMANYFHMALPWKKRAQIYESLARFLARTRPEHPKTASWSTGEDAFRRDLDRARWTVKALLFL